jgi:hypothetical protein
MTYSIQIQHFVKVCQCNLQLAEFTFAPLFDVATVFAFCSMCLRGFCLGQETVTGVRNILCLYNITKKKVLKHVKSKLHADGLRFQRWEASTTSLKV